MNQIVKQSTPNQSAIKLMQSLKHKNETELSSAEFGLTVSKCINGIKLKDAVKQFGTASVMGSLSFVILRGSQSFNIKGNITENQSITLALDLMEIYNTDTVEDILMMFKMARQGKLGGKIWRIDSQVILSEWFPEYLELKSAELEKVNRLKDTTVESSDIDNDRAQYLKFIIEKGRGENPVKQYQKKTKNITSEMTHKAYIKRLPRFCRMMSVDGLIKNQKSCEDSKLHDAVKIYQTEIDKRIEENKSKNK